MCIILVRSSSRDCRARYILVFSLLQDKNDIIIGLVLLYSIILFLSFFFFLNISHDSLVSRKLVQVHETLQVFREFLKVFLSMSCTHDHKNQGVIRNHGPFIQTPFSWVIMREMCLLLLTSDAV